LDSHYGMDEHATEPLLVDGGTYECPVNSCKEPRSSWASGLELIFAGKFGGSCDIFIHVYTCFYKYLFSWHCHSSKLRVWGRSSSASSAGRLFAPASLHKIDLQTQAILNIMQHRTVNCIVLISFNSPSASEIANNAGDVQEKSILNSWIFKKQIDPEPQIWPTATFKSGSRVSSCFTPGLENSMVGAGDVPRSWKW
jgi:hypothetical protein